MPTTNMAQFAPQNIGPVSDTGGLTYERVFIGFGTIAPGHVPKLHNRQVRKVISLTGGDPMAQVQSAFDTVYKSIGLDWTTDSIKQDPIILQFDESDIAENDEIGIGLVDGDIMSNMNRGLDKLISAQISGNAKPLYTPGTPVGMMLEAIMDDIYLVAYETRRICGNGISMAIFIDQGLDGMLNMKRLGTSSTTYRMFLTTQLAGINAVIKVDPLGHSDGYRVMFAVNEIVEVYNGREPYPLLNDVNREKHYRYYQYACSTSDFKLRGASNEIKDAALQLKSYEIIPGLLYQGGGVPEEVKKK